MKRLINTRLFEVLTDNQHKHITTRELNAIIEDFVDQLILVCNSEEGYVSLFRTLNYTRIQLQTLQGGYSHRNRAKKNVSVYQAAISYVLRIIEQEVQLLRDKLNYPMSFTVSDKPKSPIRLAPEFKALNLMEIIAPIYELQILWGVDKQPAKFIQIVQAVEWLFNFSFNGRERRIKSELYDRKRGETKFLDELRSQVLCKNTNQVVHRPKEKK